MAFAEMNRASKYLTVVCLVAVAAAAGLAVTAVHAQPIYRSVGADGRVTFSDKRPAEATGKVGSGAQIAGSGTNTLPFELKQVAAKYPVTLYTGEGCGPCASARSMLTARGIPFTEKTVNTNEDAQALQRLSGENALPFATIGGQQLKGYSDSEWTQFLNAAGYPAASVLPATYRQTPATPLVAVAPATPAGPIAAQSDANPPGAAAAPARAAPVTSNPSGIRF